MDRIFLFIYSLVSGIFAFYILVVALEWIPNPDGGAFGSFIETIRDEWIAFVLLLIYILLSLRLLYLSLRRTRTYPSSIDQRTSMGDIRISLDAIENLSLKAASRVRGTRELKSSVKFDNSGLAITIRTLVDGDTNIPQLTEEVQSNVKRYLEEITGIPVSYVSVYVANVTSTNVFKSRVD